MLVEYFLNITWIDIVGPCKDEIFFTINNGEEAIFVHACQVPSMQPAILEGLSCLFRHAPVALHNLWPTNKQLTYFTRRKRFTSMQINDAGVGSRKRDPNTAHTPFSI